MAMTSADVIGLLTPGLKTAFFDTYNEMGHQWQDVATLIPSEKDTEHYAWLGALPGVNEFKDERQTGDFTEYEYAIKNKKWESTVEVDRDTLEDDLYGQIAIKVKTMAASANQHLDLLVYGLLGSGFTSPCYDGAPMFGPHVQKQLTQTNRGTDGLSAASLQSAITQMMRFTDDQGRPMGVMPDTEACGGMAEQLNYQREKESAAARAHMAKARKTHRRRNPSPRRGREHRHAILDELVAETERLGLYR